MKWFCCCLVSTFCCAHVCFFQVVLCSLSFSSRLYLGAICQKVIWHETNRAVKMTLRVTLVPSSKRIMSHAWSTARFSTTLLRIKRVNWQHKLSFSRWSDPIRFDSTPQLWLLAVLGLRDGPGMSGACGVENICVDSLRGHLLDLYLVLRSEYWLDRTHLGQKKPNKQKNRKV